jgi:hypothetical protein
MMRTVAYDEELAGRVRVALADRPDVEEKNMLGGLSFVSDVGPTRLRARPVRVRESPRTPSTEDGPG